jgi:hypothetical protein
MLAVSNADNVQIINWYAKDNDQNSGILGRSSGFQLVAGSNGTKL